MEWMTLNGAWRLYQANEDEAIPATVPGCVHTDLLAVSKIEDPFYRDNEHDVLWIGETDWTYRRTFTVPEALLAYERVLLRCLGLDTLATVSINGREIARTANMFRTWEFDVKDCLHAGENEIEVRFDAAMPYVRAKGQERNLPAWGVGDHKLDGGGWIRKEPCNFGWDWGPMLVTCGIWRDIELVAYDTARLGDILVLQDHKEVDRVRLTVRVAADVVADASLQAQVILAFDGATVSSHTVPLVDDCAVITLTVDDPQLWWPNGMGAQPLYDLTVQLLCDGQPLDEDTRRIGLRTLKLEQAADEWGRSFYFSANGVPFFSKGANWIPADTFATRLTRADYQRLLDDTVAANMNMLRVWGGGLYEDDIFYDICDELGICVWQDFIFACATYPTFDAEFMENVRAEAQDNVRRIRHHASLALWCGNNELEQGLVGQEWTDRTMSWEDYVKLFDELLPAIVSEHDPQRDYWPSSAHTPVGDRGNANDPNSGDAHLWSVWHGKEPFEWYRGCTHRFNSEFGFQSFPEPKTVYTYTEPQDRNITTYVMEHHQRSGIGNTTIMTYMLDWFRLPSSFEMNLWLSQILQGMAIKYAVEHWRRAMPRGMGTLYWQLNDCWPVASWASIDSLGRWKALQYMAKKFYAPLLVSGLEDAEAGTVEIHVTSDLLQRTKGVVSWMLTDVSGAELASDEVTVAIDELQDTLACTLNLSDHLAQHGPRNLMLWLELVVEGERISDNFVSFARPKHLDLEVPDIEVEIAPVTDGAYTVTLSANRPALWVWLALSDADARYSDNFVHLVPGKPVAITVTPSETMSVQTLAKQLTVRSLVDTY